MNWEKRRWCACALQRQLGAVNSSHNRTGWFCWHRLNQLMYSGADEVPSRLLEPSSQEALLCASIRGGGGGGGDFPSSVHMQYYYFYELQSHKPSSEQILAAQRIGFPLSRGDCRRSGPNRVDVYDAGSWSFETGAVRAYDERLRHQLGGDWVIVIHHRTGVDCNATHFEVQSLREKFGRKKTERFSVHRSRSVSDAMFAATMGAWSSPMNASQMLIWQTCVSMR